MTSSKRAALRGGFTLVELLVVVAMIMIIAGAFTTSAAAARERARVQKATSEVKVVSQAILAYENWDQGGGRHQLPTMNKADIESGSLGFILGQGGNAQSGGKIPVMLEAALTSGGKMLDPWGTPYKVTIRQGNANLNLKTVTGSLKTGYYLPNLYRNK